MHIGIGFVTGRKHFKNVLQTYINNWTEHGLIADAQVHLHLFIAYDLKYQNTEVNDYKNIDPSLREKIDSITYIDEAATQREIERIIHSENISEAALHLLFGDGYAKKRNSVLYFAIRQKMDKLIFLDDDEYPVAVLNDEAGSLSWKGQSVVGSHLRYNDAADLTHGYHCGYISPIPTVQFDDTLRENDFRLFIETISNDIVSWKKVKEAILDNNGVTYAQETILRQSVAQEVQEDMGMKFISGANLCFNLRRFAQLPPFFNPPGARGEDTFMSTCLSENKVVKIPCYSFHDGFSTYKNLLHGVLPTRLRSVDTRSPFIIDRFAKASIGWIRYKPLLLYITQRASYKNLIEEMKNNLHQTIPVLSRYFNTNRFAQLLAELNHYDKNAEKHYSLFQRTRETWSSLLQIVPA